ncbi:MAG: hypothetical protein HOH65_13940, partial [Rhodospirillaceae bacterium]|nr:hypothetical protein [Rhodospirillaceae bacterium]
GGAGNDLLGGNAGNDTIVTGAGADTVFLLGTVGTDVVTDFSFAAGDRLHVLAGFSFTTTASGSSSHVLVNSGATVTLVGVSASSVTTDYFTTG